MFVAGMRLSGLANGQTNRSTKVSAVSAALAQRCRWRGRGTTFHLDDLGHALAVQTVGVAAGNAG
jgi:hypothetical protein